MKVYFTASLFQKEELGDVYEKIVNVLEENGDKVLASWVVDTEYGDVVKQSKEETQKFYKRTVQYINESDLVVAEASFPSTLNIGHEISVSLDKGKPVIILYKKGRDSYFLSSLDSDRLIFIEYEEDGKDIKQKLVEAIDLAKSQVDTRFNFFVTPRHVQYLDWITKHRRLPRSVYLRNLIKKDMANNKEYQAS